MKKLLISVFIILTCFKVFSLDNPEIIKNTPFTYVYIRFDSYHAFFDNFEPLFFQEIQKQNLQSKLIGTPFNIYFSETDWAIACRIQKDADVSLPLISDYYRNTRILKSIYEGSDEKMSTFFGILSSYISERNYYWDGPLILNKIVNEYDNLIYEYVIPLTKDIYKIYIKPYGIIKILISFICLLFSVFLLTYKKGRIISNRLLGIFTLICVIKDCSSYLWIYKINQYWPHLYDFSVSVDFLFAPLLLFYTLSVIKKDFKFRKIDAIHLLPFLTIAIIYFFKFQIYDTATKFEFLGNGFKNSRFFQIIYYLNIIQTAIYLSISVIYIYVYQFRNNKADLKSERVLLSTLKFLIIGLLFLLILEIVKGKVKTTILPFHYTLKGVSVLFNLVLISIILIRCLRHPEIFSYVNGNGNGHKYNKSPLTEDHKEHYLKKIKTYMEQGKPYISSTINLPELAKGISVPARYISQILNEKLEMSFYDFINKYRIEETKRILSDPENNDSIIDIAYDCGFNSKSVFNAAFKKYTGTTPTEFKSRVFFNLKHITLT